MLCPSNHLEKYRKKLHFLKSFFGKLAESGDITFFKKLQTYSTLYSFWRALNKEFQFVNGLLSSAPLQKV